MAEWEWPPIVDGSGMTGRVLSPHPNPLPQGEGTAVSRCETFVRTTANLRALFIRTKDGRRIQRVQHCKRAECDSPSPRGRGPG